MSNAGVSLMTGKVNNLPTVQETWVQYLSVEDPLEKSGYHSSTLSILAARIPWTEEPGGLYGAWGHKESERTERVTLPHFSLSWVMKICLLVFPAHVIWFYFPHPVDQLSSVQSLSRVWHFVTPWASQASLFITNSWNSPKPLSIESVMPSNHLILCCPILLLPSIFPSVRVFSNESALCIRWPKNWSFSFNISPSNEHSELISCRMDWLDLLAVQGILKSLLQHHSSKVSVLWHSVFFIVQLSHPYMTTGKTTALNLPNV